MPAFQVQQDVFFWIIPIAGLIAAILGILAIVASMGRVRQFGQCYAAYGQMNDALFDLGRHPLSVSLRLSIHKEL